MLLHFHQWCGSIHFFFTLIPLYGWIKICLSILLLMVFLFMTTLLLFNILFPFFLVFHILSIFIAKYREIDFPALDCRFSTLVDKNLRLFFFSKKLYQFTFPRAFYTFLLLQILSNILYHHIFILFIMVLVSWYFTMDAIWIFLVYNEVYIFMCIFTSHIFLFVEFQFLIFPIFPLCCLFLIDF